MLSFFEIFAWLCKFLLLKCCTKLHPFLNLICLNFYLQPKISHLSQNKLAKRAKQWRDQQWNWFSNWFVNRHNAKQALIYWCSVNLWLIYQARHCMEGKNQRGQCLSCSSFPLRPHTTIGLSTSGAPEAFPGPAFPAQCGKQQPLIQISKALHPFC